MFQKQVFSIMLLALVGMFFTVQAEFYPERIYKERKKTSLDYGWKFYRGTPSGTPSDSAYSDGGWNSVNIPHSASYDAPTADAEAKGYQGISWYRKNFTVSSSKHMQNFFIEFEGAMQVANVWLNGHFLGTHDNSGFTWFSFDATNYLSLTGNNVLVVSLDNSFNREIPPGDDYTTGFPDYYLFSGLYRNVWLVSTASTFVPLWSQQISVPIATASAASALVRVKTQVTAGTAGTVSVHYVIGYPSGNSITGIINDSIVKSLSANQTFTFDTIIGPITSPHLWSPNTPNLYTLYTQVYKDGVLQDDYVDRFGVRWYTWTPADGFALNGDTMTIRGAALHQSIGWIESALPRSRFFKEVGLVKEMGANLIRCAHFPRDPSFYNACDELGMMVMVEVPTWGNATSGYPTAFWTRLNNCMTEMIQVGYNHPSILAWGLFNEPFTDFNASNQIPLEAATAHQLDSTRYTYLADNQRNNPGILNETDIEGLNYYELTGACATMPKRIINTEYHEGWMYSCFRGGTNDNENPDGYAVQRWNLWQALFTTTRLNKLAGGCMWSFNDYWSAFIQAPMGVVDHLRIPKAVFYLFRNYWTGVPSETPVLGLTPTKLKLTSDLDSLIADSTDVAIITASFRTAGDTCVDTKSGASDSIPVTFTVTGPADYFGSSKVMANAGKCGFMIKSKNTTGIITVTANAVGYATKSITIKAVKADTTSLPFLTKLATTAVINKSAVAGIKNVTFRQNINSMLISFSSKAEAAAGVSVFNSRGQYIDCAQQISGNTIVLNTRSLAIGCYYMSSGLKKTEMLKKFFVTR